MNDVSVYVIISPVYDSRSFRYYLISIQDQLSIQENQQGVIMKLENVKTSQALSVSVLIALILVTFFMALPKF